MMSRSSTPRSCGVLFGGLPWHGRSKRKHTQKKNINVLARSCDAVGQSWTPRLLADQRVYDPLRRPGRPETASHRNTLNTMTSAACAQLKHTALFPRNSSGSRTEVGCP